VGFFNRRRAYEVITPPLDPLDLTGFDEVKQGGIVNASFCHSLACMIGYDYVLGEADAVHHVINADLCQALTL
jgi:hypothetical protein